MWAKVWAKCGCHLVLAHVTEGVAIHGTVCQTQGAGIELVSLYMVADPFQNMFCSPVLRVGLPVPMSS